MKIAILSNSHLTDDVRIYYKIARSLAKIAPIKIFTTRGKNISDKNISTQLLPTSKKDFIKSAIININKYNPDIIICVEPFTLIFGLYFKLIKRKKIVYDCHEFFAEAYAEKSRFPSFAYKFYWFFEKCLINFTDLVLSVNRYHQKHLKQANNNVIITYNNPLKEEVIFNPKKEYDIVYIGGINKFKGVFKLLQACQIIKNKFPNLKVAFAGKFIDKTTENEFHTFIKENKLENHIFYLGILEKQEVGKLLAKSRFGYCLHNVYKSNRTSKSIALKLLEYMQAGLPVLTNNLNIYNEELNGAMFNFAEFNTKSIAKKFEEMLNFSKEEYEIQMKTNLRFINEKMNWESEEKKLINAIKKLNNSIPMLVFAYFYPPLGGPGVQRPCKMIKYLNKIGFNCDVISVDSPIYHSYDQAMTTECNAKNTFYTKSLDVMSLLKNMLPRSNNAQQKLYFNSNDKLKAFIRNSFFIDDKIGWIPFAFTRGIIQCLKNDYDFIFATIGPYSSSVVAYLVSKLFKKKLIIDYRDHWTCNPYYKFLTPIHKFVAEFLEKKIINHASLISMYSKSATEELAFKFGKNISNKIHVMYNGFDEEDFINIKPEKSQKINISYIGNFYGLRTPEYFIKALEEIKAEEESLLQNVQINFVGNYFKKEQDLFENTKIKSYLNIQNQVDHKTAVQKMCSSDILLLFISSDSGKGEITGKIFEYLRSQKPILAMIPINSEASEILRNYGHTNICPMEDVGLIKKNLKEMLKNINASYKCDDQFSRENQTVLFYQKLKNL